MPVPSNISELSTTPGLNSPPGSESPTTADDYIRTAMAFIAQQRDQITVLQAAQAPIGAIIMWDQATLPTGWALCDGTGGTPNLRDRFIVGAGTTYALGATGGAATVALSVAEMPNHSHTGGTGASGAHNHSVNDPGHVHATLLYNGANVNAGSGAPRYIGDQPTVGAFTGISLNAAADHAHAITAEGGSTAHENRPPYYALSFIKRIS